MQETLALLRDIHLPDAPSLWPLAIGWWLIIILLISIVAAVFFSLRRKHLRNTPETPSTPSYDALATFDHIVEQYKRDSNKQRLLQNVSMLLRKANITTKPANHSLTGSLWLAELDKQYCTDKFSNEYAALFQHQQYAKQNHFNASALITFIATCLQQPLHDNDSSTKHEIVSDA